MGDILGTGFGSAALLFIAGGMLGAAWVRFGRADAAATERPPSFPADKPVYVLASGAVRDAGKMAAYREAATPLAQQAGLTILGKTDRIVTVEGN